VVPAGTANTLPVSGVPISTTAGAADVKLSWSGPEKLKVGERAELALWLESANGLRASPVQLTLDPAQWEVVSVREGDFFNRTGQGSFSFQTDPASGRVLIAAASNESEGASGRARLAVLEVRPKQAGASSVHIIKLTPVGRKTALAPPAPPPPLILEVAP
jgi:hypothetical protein